ncbi:MAG TPA: type IV pilus assembly protein PilM [Actinomycetota bacterium]|nr:type IV pilus assembly protein PilM [Actinomycetota bacterium]
MPLGIRPPALGARPVAGLDIGTSAVRAARVASTRRGLQLKRFAQVALPPGAVVDGEVREPRMVSDAIAQLWKRGRLGPKRAVVGVASQRVIVRQVDLPYLEPKELRQSLSFQVADHIPMPVEEAELDYQVLEEYSAEGGERMMRVLVVAAATDMVEGLVSAARGAGIDPAGVDVAPFAVARAVSPVARGEEGMAGAEAVIDVGAGVTNIVVHYNGEPRFVRILLIGGNAATTALAQELDLELDEAEALKLDIARGMPLPDAGAIVASKVNELVSEIRGSIDYFMSQEDSDGIASVIVTGGGSLTPGLVDSLEAALGTPVRTAAPLSELEAGGAGLSPGQMDQVDPVAAAAIGLAMGEPLR